MATTQLNLNVNQTYDAVVATVGSAISGGGSAQFTFDNSLTKSDAMQILIKFQEYITRANTFA